MSFHFCPEVHAGTKVACRFDEISSNSVNLHWSDDRGNFILICQSQISLALGHFRVLLCLCFKPSLSAKPFIWKWFLLAVSCSCRSKSFSHLESPWDRGTRELLTILVTSPGHSYANCFIRWSYVCNISADLMILAFFSRYHGRWIDSVWPEITFLRWRFERKPHQPVHFLKA